MYFEVEPLKEQKVFIIQNEWCKYFPENPLNVEIETKVLGFFDRGYPAAHFTPFYDNPDGSYFTLFYNTNFKKYIDAYAYCLEFIWGYSEDLDDDNFPITQIVRCNNVYTISEMIVKTWQNYIVEPNYHNPLD